RYTEEDSHGQQPYSPQNQRLLLSVLLQARATLPGQSEHSQEHHRQEPHDLPAQWLVEEPQQTGIACIKHTAAATTTPAPQALGSLTGAACCWLREVSSEGAATSTSWRELLSRTS